MFGERIIRRLQLNPGCFRMSIGVLLLVSLLVLNGSAAAVNFDDRYQYDHGRAIQEMTPTTMPTTNTSAPSEVPSAIPSSVPTSSPPTTGEPTEFPTRAQTASPTVLLITPSPSRTQSASPTVLSITQSPTEMPSTGKPSIASSRSPTSEPSQTESLAPSVGSSDTPTERSTGMPSKSPTQHPSLRPSVLPSTSPTLWISPSEAPSEIPSSSPSEIPSNTPSVFPTLRPSRQPTPEPSPSPSRKPTRVPTRVPTLSIAPTESGFIPLSGQPVQPAGPGTPTIDDIFFPVDALPRQSISPTVAPAGFSLTSRPNPAPTPPPVTPTLPPVTPSPTTLSPTASPVTDAPSDSPTKRPTLPPTGIPTAPPTPSPTNLPTQMPTPNPTLSPTPIPTALPTRNPTPIPTDSPSWSPTQAPATADPTPSGTLEPTLEPSPGPTMEPSESPQPSASPTRGATGVPTIEPTNRPTESPTTSYPTESPSPAPSLPMQEHYVTAVMSLSPFLTGGTLSGPPLRAWRDVTAGHIKESILNMDIDQEIMDLTVSVNVLGQAFEPGTGGGGRRFLQAGITNALIIQFDVQLLFRSAETPAEEELQALVFDAWKDESDKVAYIDGLQIGHEIFDSVDTVLVEVDGYTPPAATAPPDEGDGSGGVNVAVIAGASVGGAALLILVAFLLVRSRNGKDPTEDQEGPISQAGEPPKIAVSTEILVEPQDDVSTLGDPMFAPGGMMVAGLEKDEVTASVADDYDYAKQYRMANGAGSISGSTRDRSRLTSEDYTKNSSANSTTLSKLGRIGDSLFSDDASFEQQFAAEEERFDIVAPAGKLGMVIDTPNGGLPVVHAIKDTSVLADSVKVGDRLLSVDGEDCTAMSAMQVSKLISLKSEKPARVLVFARSKATTGP